MRKTSRRKKIRKTNRKTNRKKVKRGGGDHYKELEQKHRITIGTLINKFKKKIQISDGGTLQYNDKKEISNLISSVFLYRNMFASNLKFSEEQDELYKINSTILLSESDFFEKYNDKLLLKKLLENLESDFDNAVIVARQNLKTQEEETNLSAESKIISDNNDYDDNDDNTSKTPLIAKNTTKP